LARSAACATILPRQLGHPLNSEVAMSGISVDSANAEFWAEICGLSLARATGTAGTDRDSIRAYDRTFFGFYPYVGDFIRFDELRGKDVLEVGLGYGSVSQRIAESGANLTGLDVSHGPVDWLKHRFKIFDLTGKAIQGSILDAPFPDQSFDAVVSIGCYHHTGDMRRAISETARLLRPGGRFTLMVYNALSYYRWAKFPKDTARYFLSRSLEPLSLDGDGRRLFDHNEAGEACPVTAVTSVRALRRMLSEHFDGVRISKRNFAGHAVLRHLPRNFWLATFGPICGLDLYATMQRPQRNRRA
jgi:SAM-dependent methyltransferase